MTENRSLDDFAASGGESETEESEELEKTEESDTPSDAEETDPNDTNESADPTPDKPLATYRWSPSGHVCPACGETTDRQWRDDDEFVCASCKTW